MDGICLVVCVKICCQIEMYEKFDGNELLSYFAVKHTSEWPLMMPINIVCNTSGILIADSKRRPDPRLFI